MKYKILIVDDEPANLRVLERLFAGEYDVLTATSGAEGLDLLALHDCALIISDQRMPSMTGIEFLKQAAEMRTQTVRIILSGYTDAGDLVEAINSGVIYQYVTKPWSNADLQQTVKLAMEYYETLRTQYRFRHENERLETRLKATVRGFVNFAMEMLDMRHPEVSQHCRRTARYAQAIGESLGIEGEELEQLFLAAFLHEIAHIRIPGHLLSGVASLRGSELRLFLDYFNRGVKFLSDLPDFKEIAEVIGFQHEQFDGKGYPSNLAGDQIPLHSRIIAIADAYDEMREPRLPIAGFDHENALVILRSAAGRKYDPALISIFSDLKFKEIGINLASEPVVAYEMVSHV
jgi:response regulator RpfG family c-di-GMP phosphodiesterase